MKSNKMISRNNLKYFYNLKNNNNSKNNNFKNNNYYNTIAPGYDELYMEEQLKKLNLIKKTIDEENILRDFRNPKNLLDIGCGSGISTRFFANNFKIKNITAIDPSKELLKIAKEKDPNGKYIVCDAERSNHLHQRKKFDLIISITAIQNFHNINLALQNIKSLGKNFVLTFLKKSTKKEMIEKNIKKIFFVIKIIEEDRDIIFFCKQKTHNI